MTATTVNGLDVITDEPAESPFKTRAGTTVMWQQTRTLLLSDESVTYGCVHCDYTNKNLLSIRPHLNKHRDRKRPAPEPAPAGDEAAVAGVVERLRALDTVTAQRDEWRRRALAAEKQLTNLRRALRAVEEPTNMKGA